MQVPNWLINVSILLNIITCGPAHMSLCARLYLRSQEGHRAAQLLRWTTDKIFLIFETQHCRKAFIQWKLRQLKEQPNGNRQST